MEFSFATDTATLCVFDLERLKHRKHDDSDWWTTPDAELAEVNDGNVAFFGLGSDGVYDVALVEQPLPGSTTISIQVPSGRVFIGAGEEVTSGGLDPEGLRGIFVTLAPENYSVAVKRDGLRLVIAFMHGASRGNDFRAPILI